MPLPPPTPCPHPALGHLVPLPQWALGSPPEPSTFPARQTLPPAQRQLLQARVWCGGVGMPPFLYLFHESLPREHRRSRSRVRGRVVPAEPLPRATQAPWADSHVWSFLTSSKQYPWVRIALADRPAHGQPRGLITILAKQRRAWVCPRWVPHAERSPGQRLHLQPCGRASPRQPRHQASIQPHKVTTSTPAGIRGAHTWSSAGPCTQLAAAGHGIH